VASRTHWKLASKELRERFAMLVPDKALKAKSSKVYEWLSEKIDSSFDMEKDRTELHRQFPGLLNDPRNGVAAMSDGSGSDSDHVCSSSFDRCVV